MMTTNSVSSKSSNWNLVKISKYGKRNSQLRNINNTVHIDLHQSSKKKKQKTSIKNTITGEIFYYNPKQIDLLAESKFRQILQSCFYQDQEIKIESALNKMDEVRRLSSYDAKTIDSFVKQNMERWKKEKQLDSTFEIPCEKDLLRKLHVFRDADGKIYAMVLSTEEEKFKLHKEGGEKLITFCTDWIEGKEYIIGETRESQASAKSFENELQFYNKFHSKISGIPEKMIRIQKSTREGKARRNPMVITSYKYYQKRYTCDLMDLIKESKLNKFQKFLLIQDLAKIVKQFHEQEIEHKDIKPGNILIEKIGNNYIPKVCDFSLTEFPGAEGDNMRKGDERGLFDIKFEICEGSPGYVPPENELCIRIIDSIEKRKDGKQSRELNQKIEQILKNGRGGKRDVFAFGVVILFLFDDLKTGEGPAYRITKILNSKFEIKKENFTAYYNHIQKKIDVFIQEIKENYEKNYLITKILDVAHRMLSANPEDRLSSTEVYRRIRQLLVKKKEDKIKKCLSASAPLLSNIPSQEKKEKRSNTFPDVRVTSPISVRRKKRGKIPKRSESIPSYDLKTLIDEPQTIKRNTKNRKRRHIKISEKNAV